MSWFPILYVTVLLLAAALFCWLFCRHRRTCGPDGDDDVKSGPRP